jgi:hypothetical protein
VPPDRRFAARFASAYADGLDIYIYIKMDMSRRLQAAARHWLDPLAALHRARAERRLCIVVPVRMLRMLRGVLTGYSRGYAADVSRGFDG